MTSAGSVSINRFVSLESDKHPLLGIHSWFLEEFLKNCNIAPAKMACLNTISKTIPFWMGLLFAYLVGFVLSSFEGRSKLGAARPI